MRSLPSLSVETRQIRRITAAGTLLEGKEFGFRKRPNDGSLARTVLHRHFLTVREIPFLLGFSHCTADGGEGGTRPSPVAKGQ